MWLAVLAGALGGAVVTFASLRSQSPKTATAEAATQTLEDVLWRDLASFADEGGEKALLQLSVQSGLAPQQLQSLLEAYTKAEKDPPLQKWQWTPVE